MPQRSATQELLVEGNNDQHVVWALCNRHKVEKTFSVIVPSEGGLPADGFPAILQGIPSRLKQPDFKTLGVVIDADENIQNRWQSIRNCLMNERYDTLPEQPVAGGLICTYSNKPNIGVWLMPDNQANGMLEDFVAYLIPENDSISPIAKRYVQTIEDENLNRYPINHHSKAFIHSWLACQKRPGIPMGHAITSSMLLHNAPLANDFVNWLNQLFVLPLEG